MPFTGPDSRAWPLPELSDPEKKTVLNQYYEITTDIGEENGPDGLWWYTWTSSRDRFHSRILGDMELLARLRKAFAVGTPERFALVCPDPYLASALSRVARENGINVTQSSGNRLRWAQQRLRMRVAPLVSGLRTCRRAFAQKRLTGRSSVTSDLEPQAEGQERVLVVTQLKSKNIVNGGPTDDTFLGRLPGSISAEQHSAILFGDLVDMPEKPLRGETLNPSTPVIASSDFYSVRSMLGSLLRGLFSSINLPKNLKAERPVLAPLIKRDIHSNRGAVVYGLLFESALQRLCNDIQPTQIIHSCENNPWERACARVAKTLAPQPMVTGFMHCAVLLSHPKIIITEKEKSIRPRPQRLVCTGPRAGEIMVRYGGHSAHEMVAGCALRHEYLWQMKPWTRAERQVKNILVVLDGLPTMPGFVRFIKESLDGMTDYRTVIRPYPLDTPDTVMADAGIEISELRSLEFSKNQSLGSDFEEADLIIYKSSTAAIEAGYMGIPLINVDLQNILNGDPLFEVTGLKTVVRTPAELLAAVDHYSNMDQDEYDRQRTDLAGYIEGYLVRPTDAIADIFLGRTEVGAQV